MQYLRLLELGILNNYDVPTLRNDKYLLSTYIKKKQGTNVAI